jgi:hypothetical protein
LHQIPQLRHTLFQQQNRTKSHNRSRAGAAPKSGNLFCPPDHNRKKSRISDKIFQAEDNEQGKNKRPVPADGRRCRYFEQEGTEETVRNFSVLSVDSCSTPFALSAFICVNPRAMPDLVEALPLWAQVVQAQAGQIVAICSVFPLTIPD